MKISEAGLQIIKNYEGLRLQSYKCPAGIITLGYGHTGTYKGKPLTLGMSITKEEAEELLKQDLIKYENYVDNLQRNFNENQFSALVSFCYNCGPGRLQTLCNHRTNSQIADALLRYNRAGGKVLAGLTKRRKAERELFLKPVGNEKEVTKEDSDKESLPYKVRTCCRLNIRSGPGVEYERIRTVEKGTVLTVWAVETIGVMKWGKNGNEYFSLPNCEKI